MNKRAFFKADAQRLIQKGVSFSYGEGKDSHFIGSGVFTLTADRDGKSMWIEDYMGNWAQFHTLKEFKEYLSTI